MTGQSNKEAWQTFCASELKKITPILTSLGFVLDENQPHVRGERYLMQAVTTTHGRKLILLGKRTTDNARVVIKVANDPMGITEIQHEQMCRNLLHKINFAYNAFSSPQEILFKKRNGYLISIQKFIEQECQFIERPTPEQFRFVLNAFKAQEGARAGTHKHLKRIAKTFPIRNAEDYLQKFAHFKETVTKTLPKEQQLHDTLQKATEILTKNAETIEQYGEFLTHTDFVPHNFRIKDNKVFLLDHSSLAFGNKYEGWARFLNFMTLYNPELQQALEQYVKNNRSEGEIKSLKLMRLYRLGEIIFYYTDKLQYSEGNLQKLNRTRVDFWHQVLASVLKKEEVSESVISDYKKTRDSLRSEDEKERQKELH